VIRSSETVFENQEPLSMKSLARSQSARRRAAATAAIASVGAGILGTHSAEAAIVTIDIGPSGFNIEGVNGGEFGSSNSIDNFPMSGGGRLIVWNTTGYSGVSGSNYGSYDSVFATNGAYHSPINFSGGATIGNSFTGTWTAKTSFSAFRAYGLSPNFGPDSYLGFRTTQGNYGWIEATWDGTDFQLYSAAYEDVAGASIVAGDTGSGVAAVPEIDPNGLASGLSLVMGSAAMLEQRRRKRAAVAAAAVTA